MANREFNLAELLQRFQSGEVPVTSTYNLLNEKRQNVNRVAGVNRLRWEFKKKSRLLTPLQMAIPFNPTTGRADDEFNPNVKWRPALSATSCAKIVKHLCKENPEAHKTFMNRAGVTEWDVSEPGVFNSTDFKILREYRTPLVLTNECTSIKDAGITGQDFAIPYSVKLERDLDTGMIIGDIPPIVKIGNLVQATVYREIEELRTAVAEKNPTLYRNTRPEISNVSIPAATEDNIKDWIKAIYNDSIVSAVKPKNFLLCLEFPLSNTAAMTTEGNIPMPDFTMLENSDIKSHLVYCDYSKKYKDRVESVLSTPELDKFFDFIESDLIDSTVVEPKEPAAKMEAARNMMPVASSHSFYNQDSGGLRFEWVGDFIDAINDYRDNDSEFEKNMMVFLESRIRQANEEVVGALCDRIKASTPINFMYYTDDILKMHRDALMDIYDSEYTDLLLERGLLTLDTVDEVVDETKIQAEQVSVNAIMEEFEDEVGIADDINVEEVPV